jgi:CBS-domain-containing membrane protein
MAKEQHFDPSSPEKRWQLILSALFMTLSVVALIAMFDYANYDIDHAAGASAILFASFASSAFLLFMLPRSKAAKMTRFVKSYVIGGVMGVIGFTLLQPIGTYLSVGIMLFATALMLVWTDSVHPPAMGLTLAFIIYDVGYVGIIIVAIGVMLLIMMKKIIDWMEKVVAR